MWPETEIRSAIRHKPVRRATPLDQADTGKWQVVSNHPGSVGCQAIKQRLAGQHGAFGVVMVGRRHPLRMREGNRGVCQRISEHNYGVAAGDDLDGEMTRGMPGGIDGSDAGDDVLPRI